MQNMKSKENKKNCQVSIHAHGVNLCTADSEMFTPLIAARFMPCF